MEMFGKRGRGDAPHSEKLGQLRPRSIEQQEFLLLTTQDVLHRTKTRQKIPQKAKPRCGSKHSVITSGMEQESISTMIVSKQNKKAWTWLLLLHDKPGQKEARQVP